MSKFFSRNPRVRAFNFFDIKDYNIIRKLKFYIFNRHNYRFIIDNTHMRRILRSLDVRIHRFRL